MASTTTFLLYPNGSLDEGVDLINNLNHSPGHMGQERRNRMTKETEELIDLRVENKLKAEKIKELEEATRRLGSGPMTNLI